MVFDGVVDGRGGEDGIKAASAGGGIVLAEDGFDDGAFGDSLAGLRRVFTIGLEVVHMEAQDIPVLNGMGDGVGVELLLEEVLCGAHGGLGVHDLLLRGIGLEDGRAGEAKELGQRKEFLNRLVVLTELRSMALIEDEDDALVLEGFELLLEGGLSFLAPLLVALAVFIQREAELLDGGDDDLVRVVFGEQAANEGRGVGVFLDATFLKLVELLARLTVEVFAVNDEDTFVDVVVFLEQG